MNVVRVLVADKTLTRTKEFKGKIYGTPSFTNSSIICTAINVLALPRRPVSSSVVQVVIMPRSSA